MVQLCDFSYSAFALSGVYLLLFALVCRYYYVLRRREQQKRQAQKLFLLVLIGQTFLRIVYFLVYPLFSSTCTPSMTSHGDTSASTAEWWIHLGGNLPACMFLTAFSVLVFTFARIYHTVLLAGVVFQQKRFAMLTFLLAALNLLVFLVTLGDWIYANGGTYPFRIFNLMLVYFITSVSFILGCIFVLYGALLYYQVQQIISVSSENAYCPPTVTTESADDSTRFERDEQRKLNREFTPNRGEQQAMTTGFTPYRKDAHYHTFPATAFPTTAPYPISSFAAPLQIGSTLPPASARSAQPAHYATPSPQSGLVATPVLEPVPLDTKVDKSHSPHTYSHSISPDYSQVQRSIPSMPIIASTQGGQSPSPSQLTPARRGRYHHASLHQHEEEEEEGDADVMERAREHDGDSSSDEENIPTLVPQVHHHSNSLSVTLLPSPIKSHHRTPKKKRTLTEASVDSPDRSSSALFRSPLRSECETEPQRNPMRKIAVIAGICTICLFLRTVLLATLAAVDTSFSPITTVLYFTLSEILPLLLMLRVFNEPTPLIMIDTKTDTANGRREGEEEQ